MDFMGAEHPYILNPVRYMAAAPNGNLLPGRGSLSLSAEIHTVLYEELHFQ